MSSYLIWAFLLKNVIMNEFYDDKSSPIVTPEAFYGEKGNSADVCFVVLSNVIHSYLLKRYTCKTIGELVASNGNTPIYVFDYNKKRIAFYLSSMGSSIAGQQVIEASWNTGSEAFIMFGSAGSLDSDKSCCFVIPDKAYRGEGMSYYYSPNCNEKYISIRNANFVEKSFLKLGIPYIKGALWTTDALYRETQKLYNERKKEGCIAVDMEAAGVQAVCDFHNLDLYCFVQLGDVLNADEYKIAQLVLANHDLQKLSVALEIASDL